MDTVLITGTSTGIGYETALHLARQGFRVYATMRNLAKADPLREAIAAEPLPDELLALDVTDNASVAGAVGEVFEREGQVDVLVNNAGVGGATPLELTPEDEHRAMFEANYFGTIAMIQAVLPSMRERRGGTIVNVSSITGRVAIPCQIPYSASKWAVECASEALAHEVAAFGIRVAIVEPGVVMTKIFENSAPHTRFDRESPYIDIMRRNGKFYAAGFKRDIPCTIVAETIYHAITTDDPRLRYLVAPDAVGYATGRAKISDEEWVAMGAGLSDDDYNERFQRYFDIELR